MPTTIEATTIASDRTELHDDTRVRQLRPPTKEMPVLLPPPVGLAASVSSPPVLSPPVLSPPVLSPPVLSPPVPSSLEPSPTAPPSGPAPAAGPTAAGPSSIFAADVAPMPADFGVPMLPTVVAAAPTAARDPASTFDIDEFLATPGPGRPEPVQPRRRAVRRLLLVALLAAGGWAGATYGPDLYDEYVAEAGEGGDEVPAPLAFPAVAAVDVPIRTAEFELVGLPESPGATYRITTDFETAVSQVDITRDDGPALQILTYGDDAMIRRADAGEWYLLDRGQFPLEGRLARSDWVRTLDELLPSGVRGGAVITDSTESAISGVPTRHLTFSIDPVLFDSITDPTPTVAAGASIDVELWVDGNGLVRQISGAPRLGAQIITILRTSPDSWIPVYPAADEIAPITASALVDLGL